MAPSTARAGLATVLLALLALAAPAAAARALLNTCAACGNTCQTAGYSQYLQVADYTKSCYDPANTACDGCAIYRKYSQAASTGEFVFSHPDVSKNDHVLILPRAGCRGVEEWHSSFCGYEDIWNAAWGLLSSGALKLQKAMAINPTSRRTQHQMHVHVADIDPALQKFLAGVKVDSHVWEYADCAGWKNLQCTTPGSGKKIAGLCKSVGANDGPADVTPFAEAYPFHDMNAAAHTTTLVYSPRKDVFCVLKAVDRAAECLLKCPNAKECQEKSNISCP